MAVPIETVSAVGALILSSLSLEVISHSPQELITECVSWCFIFICGKLYLLLLKKQSRPFNSRPFNSAEISTITFGATLLSLTCSVEKITWSLAPLLGPTLIIIERGSTFLPEYHDVEDLESKEPRPKSGSKKKLMFLCAYAAIIMIALLQGDPLFGFHLKLCWIYAQLVLYWALSNRVSQPTGIKLDTIAEAIQTGVELASVMVVITLPLVILWWNGVSSIPQVGLVGILKACRWISVLVLAHESRLSVTAWTTIFAVCTNAIWVNPHGWQTGVTVLGALAALYRVSTTFPQSSTGKWVILGFALCPLWAFGMQNKFGAGMTSASWPELSSLRHGATAWTSSHHPIYHLAHDANARFEKIRRSQSQSLSAAIAEYKRRYGRAPPPGFDRWYEFAGENDVQLLDEYDYLTKSLDPFWQMPPKVLRDYVDQSLADPKANFNTLVIKDHKAELSRGSFQHAQLVELLQPVIHLLPDLKAALNEPDEPRVMVPYDILHQKTLPHSGPPSAQAGLVYFSYQDKQIVWNSATLSCPPDSIARLGLAEPKSDDLWPPFVKNLTESQDICLKPASASKQHGFLASPSTFHYTQRLVPVMSTAKFSTFQDIMIPSSYYFQGDIAKYDESKDIPWEQKKDMVYWRGTGTGGHWTEGSWSMGHRQRFVNFTNSPEAEIRLLQNRTGKWVAHGSTMQTELEKFDVKFSNFIQCDQEDCNDQESYFEKVKPDSNNDANQFKILYNLDGNSFSGRYYRFLKSNSLVFMQAMFKEWHDDRLIPWVHFVPIGLGMDELPETARYLLDDPEGKVIAAKIAKDSREWSRRVLRRSDLTAAYYRVFLEYARLLDDNRDSLV